MKNRLLSLLLFCCCTIGFAQEPVEVVVQMKAQYDRTQLQRKAETIMTRVARRDFVVKELQAFTEASQSDLMVTLRELEQQGLVSSIQSLWSANALYFTASEEVIHALAERADIESISPVKEYQCIPEAGMDLNPNTSSQRSIDGRSIAPNIMQVNAPRVWSQGYTGQGVVVAVIDSGVNYYHWDLADHLWDGGDEFPHHGIDIYNNDDDPMDDLGHGTHCAGTVCGDGTAGLVAGSAPDATLMCVKSINNEGYGGAVNFVKGMEWAVQHGCDVISMSLGIANAEIEDKILLRHTCESLLDAGVIAIICAGNEGAEFFLPLFPIPNNVRIPASCPPPFLDRDQMVNPGELSCVVTVGAVNENDTAAYFTSQGPVTWQNTEFDDYPYDPGIGLIRPDVCAPGVIIWSLTYNHNDDYDYMSGTSQATPCVAGIVALMLSKNPELTPAEICRILEDTALKLTPTKSNITGAGRVDALAAINAVMEWDGLDEAIDFPGDDIDTFNATLQIIDIHGRIVSSSKNADENLITENLSPGIYMLRTINKNQVKTKKIVIR